MDEQKINHNLRKEIKSKILGYMAAALGLVAGLAWNDAVRSLIDYLFPNKQNSLVAKFGYAIFITVIIVILTIILTRLLKGNGEDKTK